MSRAQEGGGKKKRPYKLHFTRSRVLCPILYIYGKPCRKARKERTSKGKEEKKKKGLVFSFRKFSFSFLEKKNSFTSTLSRMIHRYPQHPNQSLLRESAQ